jgi:hypothetical protein
MKILLTLSFIVNLILGYSLFIRKNQVNERERLIVESHPQKMNHVVRPLTTGAPALAIEKKDEKRKEIVELAAPDQREFQEAAEKVENDRMEFMTEVLGMSETKMAEQDQLREDFFKKSSQFWQKNPMRELSFQERRELIELEEAFHSKLLKLHGKKNWQKYQKFREDYNKKGLKRQIQDGQPFLFMGL